MAAVMDAARIGRFDIVSTLGRGAQGTVYLAQDTHLDRRVAVKTLRLDRVAEGARAHETEVMLAEARIVGRLSTRTSWPCSMPARTATCPTWCSSMSKARRSAT